MSDETTTAMTIPSYNLPAQQDDSDFDAVSGGADFMPRVQLMTDRSPKVQAEEFEKNHFALINGNTYTDIGKEVDVLVLAWRFKAIDTNGDDGIVTCYDPKLVEGKATGLFKEIADRSHEADSGCMYGPEFLIYVPKAERFATMLFGSVTMRNEAPNMKAKIGKAATMYPDMIKGKKYSYWSSKIKDCTSMFDCPTVEQVNSELERFNNPPQDTHEAVSDDEKAATSRAQ